MRSADQHMLEGRNERLDSLAESIADLRRELRALREGLAAATEELGAVHRQTEQLIALRLEEAETAAKLDGLEAVLNFEHVSARLRETVDLSEIIEHPVPHMVVTPLLPQGVYQAMLDAIPPRVFFQRATAHDQELPIPPKLAPPHSVITWMFLEDVVKRVLTPVLIDRFREHLDEHARKLCSSPVTLSEAGIALKVSDSRIVARQPGVSIPAKRGRFWDFLTVIIPLGWTDDRDDGNGPNAFQENSALVFVGSTGPHEQASLHSTAAPETERYTFEFRIAPNEEAKGKLTARMAERSLESEGVPGLRPSLP